jgi:hypothetical protein
LGLTLLGFLAPGHCCPLFLPKTFLLLASFIPKSTYLFLCHSLLCLGSLYLPFP